MFFYDAFKWIDHKMFIITLCLLSVDHETS